MNVIVTGSLGNISKPLAKQLAEKGHTVTVISSKAEKQAAIEALGATAAIGSLEDAGFLASTFTGADAVYAMVPPNFGQADQIAHYDKIVRNYVQAIRQAGIKRVVYLSSYGAHLDQGTGFILGAHHAEGLLSELTDVSVTYLRPAYFYTNLYNFIPMIKGAGFIGANYGGNDPLVMVYPGDIATIAAEELERTGAGHNIRYVASEELTASEAAKTLGAAIGKPDLQWLTLTDGQMQEGLEKSGVPPAIAALFVEMGASTHNGALRQDYDQHKPTTMGKTKLADFAKEFAAAF